jgi:thiamine-phosphate pyrophosphorylase
VDADALRGRPVAAAVRALAEGGAALVQVRAKTRPDGALLGFAREALAAARAAGLRLVVNDRADVARIAVADGVHVGQEDLPPAACRTVLGAGALVGLSTHDLAQVSAAVREPIDYLAVGPVFPTRTKANPDPVAGLDLVRRARDLWSGPLVAIGGITAANAAEVVRAGADGVAVISALLDADDLRDALRRLQGALGGRA